MRKGIRNKIASHRRTASRRGNLHFESLEKRCLLAGLIQHLDATQIESVSVDGGGIVSQWSDLSDSGSHHATANVGTVSFLGDNASDSGLPMLDFQSTRSSLELFDAAQSDVWLDQSDGTGGFTVLVSFEADSLHGLWNDLLGNSSFVASGFGLRYSSNGTMQAYLGGVSVQTSLVTPGETTVFAFSYDAASDSYRFWNSVSQSTATGTIAHRDFSAATAVTLGSINSAGRFVDANIGEVKIFDESLDAVQFQAEAVGLVNKWNAAPQPIQILDADVQGSVLVDGASAVTQWNDLSLRYEDFDATSDFGSAIFDGTAVSDMGLSMVDFGSENNRLELFSSDDSDSWLDQSAGTGGFTVMVSFDADSLVGDWNDLLGNSTAVASGFGLRYSQTGVMQAYLGGVLTNKVGGSDLRVTPGETIVYAFRYDATTSRYSFWDSANHTSAFGTVAPTDFSLAAPVSLGSIGAVMRFVDANVGEVRVYDFALNDYQFAAEREALVEKWAYPILPTVKRWSELITEDGDAPGIGDIVVVKAGDTLYLDESAQATGLVVAGDFIVEDIADLSLVSDWVLVTDGGSFQVGSEETPFTHEFTLTLEGDDPDFDLNLVEFGMSGQINNNNAYLMARGSGSSIEIHADDAAKESWTQLSQTAQAGATVLQVAEATGWEVGDRIVIASTDFDLNQAEEFTITAVTGSGQTITLDAPLQFMHYGEIETYSNGTRSWDLDMRAEVGLISRDVTIQGDADSATNRYGGHSMVMMGAQMHISGAEFTRMGQQGIIGRYPAHWHLIGDASGQYIQNSSFHNTFNKGLTVHGTQNVLVNENVVYEHIGHGYFLEDASEFDNVLSNNLAINARASDSLEVAPEPSDFNSVASFWIENADNTLIGNHAAGSEFEGFRFALQRVNGASATLGLYDHLAPETKGPTDFTGNVAHSTFEAGVFITTQLIRTIQDTQPTAEDQQLFDENWGFSDFTAYKGNDTFWPRAIGGDFYDIKLGENDRANRLRLNQTLYDSLIVGRTGNIGTPITADEIAAGRSLPPVTGHYVGHVLYDGPAGLVDSHLDGFDVDGDAAIGLLNAVQKTSYHFVSGLTFGPNVPETNKVDMSRSLNNINAEASARAVIDLDGSLTGFAGAFVTQKLGNGSLINTTPAGIARNDWTAWVNPDSKIGSIAFNSYSEALVKHDIIRSDGAELLGVEGIGVFHTQTGFIVDDQFTHTIDFADNPDNIELYLSDMLAGDGAIFEFSDFHPLSTVTIVNPYSDDSWNANEVTSLAALQAATTTSVYRGGDSVMVKFVSEMAYGWLWPQPGRLPDLSAEFLGGVVVQLDVTSIPVVEDQYLVYRSSSFDGSSLRDSIASDKTALLPGQTATFENISSYWKGINGLVIDVAGLDVTPTASDFEFRVGNDDNPDEWAMLTTAPQIELIEGGGINDSDQIHLTWSDNAIEKQWLQVTVLANSTTELASDYVFYFGNAIGETGNDPSNAIVNLLDVAETRINQSGFGTVEIDNQYDFNRDARVNLVDVTIARSNQSGFTPLQWITIPGGEGQRISGDDSISKGMGQRNFHSEQGFRKSKLVAGNELTFLGLERTISNDPISNNPSLDKNQTSRFKMSDNQPPKLVGLTRLSVLDDTFEDFESTVYEFSLDEHQDNTNISNQLAKTSELTHLELFGFASPRSD